MPCRRRSNWRLGLLGAAAGAMACAVGTAAAAECQFSDSHFHLTNYIQEGPPLGDVVKLMDGRVCRSTLFGIPLQQQWNYHLSGQIQPRYYLESDAPLYYYSFTDAVIAKAYLDLPAKDRARLDPMITGFNPADMYAADHIRRVLTLFPGVFSGIGEFSIHKEFVSPKIAGGPASLLNPAVDRILDFAGEAGLVVIFHNDLVMPFNKDTEIRPYFSQLRDLFAHHPKTTIIWAHLGVGRVVQPVKSHLLYIEEMLTDPGLPNVYFDISWDETAKYILASPQTIQATADLINRHPDHFLFGTDVVAPKSPEQYFAVYEMYRPLWTKLTPEARDKVLKGNYSRLFDAARVRVRAWEKANPRQAAGKP